jgi:hypothetical protein
MLGRQHAGRPLWPLDNQYSVARNVLEAEFPHLLWFLQSVEIGMVEGDRAPILPEDDKRLRRN